MSLPIPVFTFIPMSAAAFIHNRWAVKSEQKESETACGLAEHVRVYCGRRSEEDGYGAMHRSNRETERIWSDWHISK